MTEQQLDLEHIARIVDDVGCGPDGVVPILQAIQEHYRYLPPEALQGETQGAPGDMFALGVVLYEMLTGAPPFVGDSMAVYNSGFWADHWTYLMEHIESYISIYPDPI